MMLNTEENKIMIDYLLGELPEEEQAVIEQRFFNDEEFHERLSEVETDLIDCYGSGDLSGRQRTLFERKFLISPERRQRARFARALGVVIDDSRTVAIEQLEPKSVGRSRLSAISAWFGVPSPGWALAGASLTVLLLASTIWLWTDARRLRGQAEQLAASQQESERLREQLNSERAANEDLSARLASEQDQLAVNQKRAEELSAQLSKQERERAPAVSALPAISFLLSPGIARGAQEPTRLAVPGSAKQIRLDLELLSGSAYPRYRVEVRTAGGNLVWSQSISGKGSGRGALGVTLATNIFVAGEYELTLQGVTAASQLEDVGYYYFKVVRR